MHGTHQGAEVFPKSEDEAKMVMWKGICPRLSYPSSSATWSSKGISVLRISTPKGDCKIRGTRLLTAIPSSTFLIPVLWTTVLSHCSYSEAGRCKNGETHYAERKKKIEIWRQKVGWAIKCRQVRRLRMRCEYLNYKGEQRSARIKRYRDGLCKDIGKTSGQKEKAHKSHTKVYARNVEKEGS